ncbi:MAG: hypothetical protein JW726_02830 [Anaerolineales bacterium]|nr:hypothetical protein [Anaerolineales bacterium]
MENVRKFTQAYTQAPWRKQTEGIGLFMLALVVVALVAGIYLNITARATAIGREIMEMQILMYGYHNLTTELKSGTMPIEELYQNIADLEAQLAHLTSYEVMDARARQLGLEPAAPEAMIYMEVEGYTEPQPSVMAPPAVPMVVSAAGVPSEFNQPLFTWLGEQLEKTVQMFTMEQPGGQGEVKP